MVKQHEGLFVLGASGFLGATVAKHFSAFGIPVIGIDVVPTQDASPFADFHQSQNPEDIIGSLLDQYRPAYLVNVAGNANVGRSLLEPHFDFANSVNLFSAVLDKVRRFSGETRVLFASSAAVYGEPKTLPINEMQAPAPISPYGYHKWMCEQLAIEYSSVFGVQVASMRIFSAFGAGLRKQIFWDLCEKCRSGGPIELGGDGSETRDFIHAVDIARAAEKILVGGRFHGDVYNVASGLETSISDLARQVVSCYGLPSERLTFTGHTRLGDPKYWRADVEALKALSFCPTIDFASGVRQYVEWYKSLP